MPASQNIGALMQKLRVAGLVAAILMTSYGIWAIRSQRIQEQEDAQVVADIHNLVERHFAALEAGDPIISRYGAFKSWERGGWSRPHYLGMLIPHLRTDGIAHFERADEDIHVSITTGPKGLDVQMHPTDEWLGERPDRRRLSESGRQVYFESENGRHQCGINASARHPDFVPD